jgi:hypothetical protein
MRHQPSEAGGLGVRFPEFPEARFQAAPIGPGNERKQAPHFTAGSCDRSMESLNAGDRGRRFQLPGNELDELAVGFRAQFDEFEVVRPGSHDPVFLINRRANGVFGLARKVKKLLTKQTRGLS